MYAFQLHSPCCAWVLTVHTHCPQVAQLVERLYGGFLTKEVPMGETACLQVNIHQRENGYLMTGGGKEYPLKSLEEVGFYLYAVVEKLVETHENGAYCVFHGGAVAKNGRAYGIVAPTMTGKSTLVAYLALTGFDYLADDYLFVKRDSLQIAPLPLPCSLRSREVLAGLLERAYSITGHNPLRGAEQTLAALYRGESGQVHLNGLFFIHRGEENGLRPMEKGRLYQAMLWNMKSAKNLERERIAVKQMVDRVEGYELWYRDLDFAASCLDRG